jgi:peroxiredoxin
MEPVRSSPQDQGMSASIASSVVDAAPLLKVGDPFRPRELTTLHGRPVRVPARGRFVHLQLRRYAGCPVCGLHLRAFVRRHDELVSAGVSEVAVFHSSAKELRKVHADLPFAVVPDPDKQLYAELGIGASARALLDPRAWSALATGVLVGASRNPLAGGGDGSFGLPGDFLIAPDARIVALRRGAHADDHWSVGDVLELARVHEGER